MLVLRKIVRRERNAEMSVRLLLILGCVLGCVHGGVGCGGNKPPAQQDPVTPTEAISSPAAQSGLTKTTAQADDLKPGIPNIEENSAAAAVLY